MERREFFTTPGLDEIGRYLGQYVTDGRLAGYSLLLWRDGDERFFECDGVQDLESGRPITRDTIFRIYSMTKPVASVALMMLHEEGRFDLDDPVARFLPAFENMSVYSPDDAGGHRTEPARGPITIRQLLNHTSGLILPAFSESPLKALYLAEGVNGSRSEGTLAAVVDRLAGLPLLFHPGTRWEYSMATDVVGRLVEVIDGRAFDTFLEQRLFGPLAMRDTGFHVEDSAINRFAGNYTREGEGPLTALETPTESRFRAPPRYLSGNGGLVGTLPD